MGEARFREFDRASSGWKAALTVKAASNMASPHISVCICTFKRAGLLRRGLERLVEQRTDGLFTFSVVVSDNDPGQSARQAVELFAISAPFRVTYCSEPRQNIALARNKALEHAEGEFIAFFDDDEYPDPEWLLNSFKTCEKCGVDGVLGPVRPYFEHEPPEWAKKGRFFERAENQTGQNVPANQLRTGNLLFKRAILNSGEVPFRPEFGTGGEDVDFFRRIMEQGRTFTWCNEAPVYELVPESRSTRGYLLRRALLRGSNVSKFRKDRIKNAAKSLIAVPSYALALPVLALFGQHVLLKYLIKLCDHAGRLMAFVGVKPVTQRDL